MDDRIKSLIGIACLIFTLASGSPVHSGSGSDTSGQDGGSGSPSSGQLEYSLKVNIVNITNAEEFLEAGPGAGGDVKLALNVTGPFVYNVHVFKSDAVRNANGTITFKTKKIYIFNAEKSIEADDKTLFTVPNVPYLSLITAKSAGLSGRGNENEDELEDFLISASNAEPFVQRSVQELLWGYEDPLLKLMEEKGLRKKAMWGLFLDDEDSESILTVASSSDLKPPHTDARGQYQDSYDSIQMLNGKTHFDTWGSQFCDQINGTDFMDPHVRIINPELQLPVYYFNSQICRPFKFSLESNETDKDGRQLLRYAPHDEYFGSIADYPNNQCFCSARKCSLPGTLDLSKCKSQSNGIAISWPYFISSDDSINEKVASNFLPLENLPEQTLELDAISGKIAALKWSIQWNIQMEQNEDVPQSLNFTRTLIPFIQTTDSIEKVVSRQSSIGNEKEMDGDIVYHFQVLDEKSGRQASEPLELKDEVKDAKKIIKVVKAVKSLKKQKKKKSSASTVNSNAYHWITLPTILMAGKFLLSSSGI